MTEERAPDRRQPDRSLAYAIAASIVLVLAAVAGGAVLSRSVRAAATPSPSLVPPIAVVPSPTEPPSTEPLVFTQTLSAGCAAGDGIYVVSDGGGIGRFAFDRWQLIDETARSLVAATCQGDVLVAVGGGGRVVTINDRDRTVRSDSIVRDDLLGVTPLADGVLVVGRAGTVQRQGGGSWGAYAVDLTEDLFGIVAFSGDSAWAVGAGGVSYRLEPAGWRPVATGVTTTLRAVAGRAVDDVVAVGDGGVILVWAGRWTRADADAPVHVSYRAALRVGDVTYIAGDGGTLVRFTGGATSPSFALVPLGTTCTLRGLFARGDGVWVVGSDGGHAAVWRVGAAGLATWGACP